MEITSKEGESAYVRYSVTKEQKEVAHAFVYIIRNDRHKEPYAFLENVLVTESERGSGIGTELLQYVIRDVRERGCYKLIGTSRLEREKVHSLYRRLGFEEWGKEFRMNLLESEVVGE